jgi:hypothetical protein
VATELFNAHHSGAGDLAKLATTRWLRAETTMTLAWIAERLNMGTKTHLAHLLYWQRRNNEKHEKARY